jgi:hypothetical protein
VPSYHSNYSNQYIRRLLIPADPSAAAETVPLGVLYGRNCYVATSDMADMDMSLGVRYVPPKLKRRVSDIATTDTSFV